MKAQTTEEVPNRERVIFLEPDDRFHRGTAKLVAVKVGETGYYPVETKATAEELNHTPMTEEERQAAITASMFGWHKTELTKPIHDWVLRRWVSNQES